MKKILLSCVTCLLAVGLLAGCEDEVEEVPSEPEISDTEKEDDSSTESGPVVVKTGKLGFLQANKGAYYYFTGELNSSGFGICSTDFSEGADVTVSKEEDSYYLSIEVEKETLYLSCPDTEHSAMELSKDPYALVYNAEFDTFTTVDDTKFLGTYGTYETLCWANLYYNGVSNLGVDDEFCASVFTSAQTNPTKPESGDEEDTNSPYLEVQTLTSGESYYFGYPNGEDYYFFNGSLYYTSALYCSDNVEEALMVTVTGDDTNGWTLTYTGTDSKEYTIYCYLYTNTSTSSTSASITAVKTSGLEDALKDDSEASKTNATATFTWDSEHAGLSVMLGETACYVSTYAQYKEISLSKGNFDYAASHFYTANPDYVEPEPEPVPEVVEPDVDNDETYKLGVLDTTNAVYRYFDGSTHENNGTFLTTTTEWAQAAEVYITAQPNYTEENSCTLSTVVEDELKYISFDNSSTSVTLSATPCVVVYDENYGVFAVGHNLYVSGADRILLLNTNNSDIRAYQGTSSYLNGSYDLVKAFEGETAPSLPDVTSITVSGATTVEVGSTITLVATIEPKGASTEVTWSSSSEKATVDATTGEVTGVAATTGEEVVTITATSTYTASVSGSIEITVTEAEEEPENLIGTFDFSNADFAKKQSTTAVSDSDTLLADLKLAYTGNGNDLSSVSNISYVYCGGDSSNGSKSTLQPSAECLKLGKGSSTAGSVSITFSDETIEIAKVVIVWCPYSVSNLGLVVNGETQTYATVASSYTTWDAVTETVYDSITETGNVLSLASAKGSATGSNYGALIHSIKLYSAEA